MKKLIIVISSMSFGGAEIQTLQLANGLVESGYDIDIIVLDNMRYSVSKADPRIRFHFMDKKRYLDMIAVRKIAEMLKNINPDRILCVDMYPTMYVSIAQSILKKSFKTVTVIHSTLPRNSKEKLQRVLLMPFLKRVQKMVFVSENQKNYWIKNYRLDTSRSAVIHNGVDIKSFADFIEEGIDKEIYKLKKKLDKENSIIIGSCARFRVEKRHTDLIQATAALKDKGYNVKLLLAGDGEMREAIEQSLIKFGIEEDSYITGYKSDIRPYLSLMDIFVLSSDSVETLSIAAIEALAMRKSLVLSDIGGASELVKDGVNGYLYKAADIEQLTQKLEKIIVSKNYNEMGEKGYLHALENFEAEDMTRAYEELFEKLKLSRGAIKYLYRIDDIHPKMLWGRFNEIMQVFDEYGVVPLLGLIPDNQDESLMACPENTDYYDIIHDLIERGRAEISQHGVIHVYETKQASINQYLYGRVSPSEFANLSYKNQYEKIKNGRLRLQSEGFYTDVWMAPSHTSDKKTFKALKDLEFKYVTDGVALFPYKKHGLIFIPQQVWEPKEEFGCGIFTICLHPDDLTDELIEKIRRHLESEDQIISFTQAVNLPFRWYYPLMNGMYKGKRIAYHHIVRRYREHKYNKAEDISTRVDSVSKTESQKCSRENPTSQKYLQPAGKMDCIPEKNRDKYN